MDFVAQTDETTIPIILEPTIRAFIPLLEKNREQIKSIKKETFKYGTTDRHQLDVYYPPGSSPTNSPKPPILFFIYGGGFNSGERSFPAPLDLAYATVGAFFAARGILTIIPDYRLVPHVAYPASAEDVRDALVYAVQNVTEGDPNRLFILGHSAGAVHTATLLLHTPSLLQATTLAPRIKGVLLFGGSHHFNGRPAAPPDVLTQYYGDAPALAAHAPFGLLEVASKEAVAELPPVLLLTSEKEPPGIQLANEDFAKLLEAKTGKVTEWKVAKGHNHISVSWALGTGEGEEWGEEAAAWIKAHV